MQPRHATFMLAAKPWLQRIAVDDRVPCEGPNPSRLLLRHLRRRGRTSCVNGAMLRRIRNGGPLNPATRNFLHNKLQSPSHSTFHSETSKGRFVFLNQAFVKKKNQFLAGLRRERALWWWPAGGSLYRRAERSGSTYNNYSLSNFTPRVIPTVAGPVINPTWKVLLIVCRCQGFVEGSIQLLPR